MRVTVIGSGAIGGTVGAHLRRAGHDVLFCDADAAHVSAINAAGLRITGPVEDFIVTAPAVTPDDLPERLSDVVLVSVKTQHTASAAALLRDRLEPGTTVVSLQNGLTFDVLGDAVGLSNLLVCFVNFGADYLSPGVVMQGNVGTFRIGELDGRCTERLRRIADALPYAQPTDSILGYLWAKEAYGAMLFAGAVSDLSIADSLERPEYRPLMIAVAREVLAQSPVTPLGFDGFEPDDLEGSLQRLVAFNRGSAKSHSGIYRDLAVRHRPTEVSEQIDVLSGPLTHHVGALIRAIERGERVCEVANLDLLAAVERAYRLGVPLHAVVAVLPAPARASDGPLHGLAVAVKDIVDVAGSPRGNGNPIDMAGPRAAQDAPVVAALRAAGADVFALASLLEYAAGAPHPDLPEARKPERPDRTAGGSSGGSAALVGAGVCRAALGTDTGGSIRIPAAYCGVVGLKPSHGLLDLAGVTALSPTLDHLGVIADTVQTASRVMAALTPSSAEARASVASDCRLGVLEGQLADPRLDPELAAITRAALARLAAAGMTLAPRDSTVLAELGECLDDILLVEAWRVHGSAVSSDPDHFGATTLRLFRTAGTVVPERRNAALARRDGLLPRAAGLLDGVDVLVGPAVPYAAPIDTPPIDTPDGEIEGIFSGPYNVTGQPAVVVPCGLTADGLPVALQLAGRIGHDVGLLAVAAAVEAVLQPVFALGQQSP
jgi:2-dehydropantoate 2-reductase